MAPVSLKAGVSSLGHTRPVMTILAVLLAGPLALADTIHVEVELTGDEVRLIDEVRASDLTPLSLIHI